MQVHLVQEEHFDAFLENSTSIQTPEAIITIECINLNKNC
jgi:hypothetical protein